MQTEIAAAIKEFKNNERLRFGIWIIIALLLSYFLFTLNDYKTQLYQNHQNELGRLAQLQDIVKQNEWVERAAKAKILRDTLETKFWQASTPGLAQATFQKWLDMEIAKTKMEKAYLRIESSSAVPNEPDLTKITARLDANFIIKQLSSLLLATAKSPFFVTIERLEIRNANRAPRFTLIISGYFKLTNDI